MLAMAGAGLALGILFLSKTFPLSPKTRLWLSVLATGTIGFFAEFRNEGKFHLKVPVHFFGPGTWIHDGVNRLLPSAGDFLYRIEYSHWNDFLMGPAIVSILFFLVSAKVYGALQDQGPISLSEPTEEVSTNLDQALRFARILMNVGLFWFFLQAWAEKAGYLHNPHSSDEIDLPVEFAGTMLGFWMARILTKPFNERNEEFRSTFLIDFVSAGVIGLLYTLVIGQLTESVAGSVAHSLYPVVPRSLEAHEYTTLQRYVRPFELLLLAGTMWWVLNRDSEPDQVALLSSSGEEPKADSKWDALFMMGKALGVTAGYFLIVVTMLSILEPEGIGWTLATAATAVGVATAAVILLRRTGRRNFRAVLHETED